MQHAQELKKFFLLFFASITIFSGQVLWQSWRVYLLISSQRIHLLDCKRYIELKSYVYRCCTASGWSTIYNSKIGFCLYLQMVMAIFAYIYIQSFIIPQTYPVEIILDQVSLFRSRNAEQGPNSLEIAAFSFWITYFLVQILRSLTFEEQKDLLKKLELALAERQFGTIWSRILFCCYFFLSSRNRKLQET